MFVSHSYNKIAKQRRHVQQLMYFIHFSFSKRNEWNGNWLCLTTFVVNVFWLWIKKAKQESWLFFLLWNEKINGTYPLVKKTMKNDTYQWTVRCTTICIRYFYQGILVNSTDVWQLYYEIPRALLYRVMRQIGSTQNIIWNTHFFVQIYMRSFSLEYINLYDRTLETVSHLSILLTFSKLIIVL